MRKVKNDAVVPQEVSAQNAALEEPGSLVYGLEIEYRGIDIFAAIRTNRDSSQHRNFHILRDARSAIDAHATGTNELLRLVHSGGSLRKHRDGGARVNDEVHRFGKTINQNFAAQEPAGSRPNRDIDRRRSCDHDCIWNWIRRRTLRSLLILALPIQRQLHIAVINRGHHVIDCGNAQISIDRICLVIEVTNIYRHVGELDFTNLERVEISVNDFEFAAATDCSRHAAAGHGSDANLTRSLFGKNGHTGTGVEYETQSLLRPIYFDLQYRPEIRRVKGNYGAIGSVYVIERTLLPEVTKKVDQATNSRAAIFVGARRYLQKSFVGISRLFVTFRAGGRLAKTENVIRLVAIDRNRTAHTRQAARHPVLVIIDHCQTGDSDRFVLIQGKGRAKLFDR